MAITNGRFAVFSLVVFLFFSSACAIGYFADDELTHAFECAMLDTQGGIQSMLKRDHSPLTPIEDCFMNPSYFKYPTLSVSGSLFQVLISNNLHVGVFEDDPFVETVKMTVRTAAKRMFEKYKFSYNETVFKSEPNIVNLIGDLKYSSYDLIYPGINTVMFNATKISNLRRVCSMMSYELRIATTTASNIHAFNALLAKAKHEPLLLLIVSHHSEGDIMKERYNLNYIVIPGTEAARQAELKNNPTKYIGLLTHADIYDRIPGLKIFHVGYSIPIPIYFRKESTFDFVDRNPLPHEIGNVQLMRLFDAALYEEQKDPTMYNLNWDNEKLCLVGDCLFFQPEYPRDTDLYKFSDYDGSTADTFLLNVFQKGRPLTLGYVAEESHPLISTLTVTTINDKDVFIPDMDQKMLIAGKLPDLESRLINRISTHYKLVKPIRIQQKVYETSDEVFAALEKGEIDATSLSFSLGSQYNSIPRRWQFLYSCTGAAYHLSFYLNREKYEKTVKNFDELSSVVGNLTSNHVIMVGTDRLVTVVLELLYPPIFMSNPSTFKHITFKVVKDHDAAFEHLKSGDYEGPVLAYLPRFLGQIPPKFKGAVYGVPARHAIPVGMFFRRDKMHTPKETDNTNENGPIFNTIAVIFIAIFGSLSLLIAIRIICSSGNSYTMHTPQHEEEVASEVLIEKPSLSHRRRKD